MNDNEKQFIDHIEYTKNIMCAAFGILSCMIDGYKETRWQKIKRKFKLAIWKINDKFKRKKKHKPDLGKALYWIRVLENLKTLR